MNEPISERMRKREEMIKSHTEIIEHEIDDLLADDGEALSEEDRKAVKDEFLSYSALVLEALSSEELANLLRLEDFIDSVKTQAGVRIRERMQLADRRLGVAINRRNTCQSC
jgi:hypothetical protein